MRIVIATPVYPPEENKETPYLKELVARLQSRHQVVVVAYADYPENLFGVEVKKVSKGRNLIVRLLRFSIVLSRASAGADAIYVQEILAAGLPAVLVSLLKGIPIILKFSKAEVDRRVKNLNKFSRWFFSWLQKIIIKRAQRIIVNSKSQKRDVENIYKTKNIVVNYNPVDNFESLPFVDHKKTRRILLSADHLPFLEAIRTIDELEKVLRKFPRLIFFIKGRLGDSEKVKKYISDKDLSANIVLLGQTAKAESQYYLRTSQVCVLFKNFFSDPGEVFGSWQAETVAVAEDCEIYLEVIKDGYNGLIFFTNKEGSLSGVLTKIFNDKDLFQNICRTAKKELEQNYSWSQHLARLEEILNK